MPYRKIIGIYKLTSPSGGVYVGQSTSIHHRFSHYRHLRCKTQPRLYRSMNYHGSNNFKYEIIHEFPSEVPQVILNFWEVLYIEYYKKTGYIMLNTKEGGSAGKMSEETKRKISIANTGKRRTKEARIKMSKAHNGKSAFKGKKHTTKTRQHIKDVLAIMDRTGFNAPHRREIIDTTTTNIIYPSITAAAKAIGMKRTTLVAKLTGQISNNTNMEYTS